MMQERVEEICHTLERIEAKVIEIQGVVTRFTVLHMKSHIHPTPCDHKAKDPTTQTVASAPPSHPVTRALRLEWAVL